MLRTVFWPKFQATGEFRTVFFTRFSFFRKVANFKNKDSFAECFDANFEHQDSCGGCFAPALTLTKVAKFKRNDSCAVFWGQFRETGQLRTVFWTRFSNLTKVVKLKKNDSCPECFDANFKQQDSCAQCFAEGLAFLEKLPISRPKTVSQSVSTPSLSNRTVAHALLGKFKLFNKSRQIQAKRQFRRVF